MEYDKIPLVHAMVNSNQGVWVEVRVIDDGVVEITCTGSSETPIVIRPDGAVFAQISQPTKNVLILRLLRGRKISPDEEYEALVDKCASIIEGALNHFPGTICDDSPDGMARAIVKVISEKVKEWPAEEICARLKAMPFADD